VLISTVELMAVDRSWRTPDNRWLVDEVVDEPGVGYRFWHDGEFAGEVANDQAALLDWLATHDIDVARLEPASGDPFCE